MRSFTEKVYAWKSGDSYEKLSENYYYTPKLAAALKKYNKNHPQATDNLQGGGEPAPGEHIYIPPVAQLDGSDLSSLPPNALPSATPLNSAPGGTLPTYKVTQENTYIVNVAKDTLKQGERWVELRQLNAHIDPEKPLPIGTILRLPADAVVPPAANH